MTPWLDAPTWAAVAVHVGACGLSIWSGGRLAAFALQRLRGKQASAGGPPMPVRGFPRGAGQVIGWAERFLAYVTVLVGAWTILSVLVALKTLVRYPEVRIDAQREHDAQSGAPRELRFAEYYLVGTLVSLAVGIGVPILAMAAVGSPLA